MILRISRIVVAYFLASAASGLVVALVVGSPQAAPLITAIIAIYAFPPSLAAIVYGERQGLRNVLNYSAVAVAIGVALPLITFGPRNGWTLPLTGLAFGPIAGALYWYIAGKHAGTSAT